jgi:outer membrane protein assembly factor BamB
MQIANCKLQIEDQEAHRVSRRRRPILNFQFSIFNLQFLLLLFPPLAQAQLRIVTPSSLFELSESVQLDRADDVALAHLERARACVKEHQWDEAVETLRQVMENSEGKLLAVTPWRYVNLCDACQMRLAALPPEALRLYRRRVDPLAQKWCEEGIATRDAKLLTRVVQQAFASSWGDKALMALGEMRLEEGDYAAARWCWERILPVAVPPGTVQLSESNTWPGYPDSTLDPAAVRARLVLVSILEGSQSRARDELSQFVRLHGETRGRMAGHEVRYATALSDLLSQSSLWPKARPVPDWPTFAGSSARNAIAEDFVDAAGVEWRARLGQSNPPAMAQIWPPSAPVADGPAAPLSFYPVICQGRLFVADQTHIWGFRADTGHPAWGNNGPTIYTNPVDAPLPSTGDRFGTPRFTLAVADGRIYARMGLPITNSLPGAPAAGDSIVCLDIRGEGKQLWSVRPEEGWAFDGTPVVAGARLFVAMRRNDIRPQAHVACFDATTGRMRWRRFVCAAESPARDLLPECTNTLLTLAGGTIFVNTNLGAVASLAAEDGRIDWVSLYPRARRGDLRHLAAHWQRDVNPCLFDHGRLFVAPADSPRIYALDAATGQILWPGRQDDRPSEFPVQAPLDDVVHLLGTVSNASASGGDCLIAGGSKLYWIDIAGPRAGNIAHVWPEGDEKLGYGRGLLAGAYVLWPTREKIYVFHQQTARLKREIELAPLGARGGNLLVADGRLLIATPNELIALGTRAGRKKEPRAELTRNDSEDGNLKSQIRNLKQILNFKFQISNRNEVQVFCFGN